MNRRFFPALWMLAAVTVTMGSTNTNALANIPTCDLHNGMRIWFLDYADDDYTLSHPLGRTEHENFRTFQLSEER